MAAYRPPLRDIFFVLDHLVDLPALAALDAFANADPATVRGVLEENARFVSEVIAPLNRIGDLQGSVHDPTTNTVTTPEGFKEAYRRYVEAGWGGVPFPTHYGGGGFPWLVGIAMQELISSANMSFSMAPLLTQGAIDLLSHHGSEEQKEVFLRKMVTGEWTGTMNLTEPQAGSDVGAVRTRAVRQDDGTYRITGTKIFITFGEHDLADNIVHLVLARTPDAPPGTKGISCFIVPKYLVNDDGSLGERNDVACVSIEHKMGIKASPTCVMSYGDHGGAVGYLVGEENQGMRYMFTMMNNARLSVGLEGLAIGERAWQDALEYAQQRRQGRAPGAPPGETSPIIEHPDVRRMLLTMKASVEAMRNIVYVCAEAVDRSTHHPDESVRAASKELLDLLIPVAKAWSTDTGIEVTSLAIQVYGGMGYIEESGVPQHYRDARITAIYEGTNGIQAMDLVGRKLPMRDGRAVADYFELIASIDPALEKAGDELSATRAALGGALDTVTETTRWLMERGLAEPRDALAGATPFLRMFSLLTAGWLMARQALAARDAQQEASGQELEFLRAKVTTARFFCEQLLPAVEGLRAAVTAGHEQLFAVSPEAISG
ncbi:acyl-CoA dehydrogenase [Rhabdothermincola sp.]|uniref:acyl-CoA dehydrogenase n=1 Tax=Rhabdothermincola sp. TaxID=2820405 RepID=UPI002FDF6AE9